MDAIKSATEELRQAREILEQRANLLMEYATAALVEGEPAAAAKWEGQSHGLRCGAHAIDGAICTLIKAGLTPP